MSEPIEFRCPKCGSRSLAVRYEWRYMLPDKPSMLAIECYRCGYRWDEAPLDERTEVAR